MASYACKLYLIVASFSLAVPGSLPSTEHCSTDSETCDHLPYLAVDELRGHIHDRCILLAVPPLSIETRFMLYGLQEVFANESSVFVGQLRGNSTGIHWETSPPTSTSVLAFYTREKRERSCLLLPPKKDFWAEPYTGPLVLETLVQFLNEKCGTFRTRTGGLTEEGLMHQHIMQNLYHPSEPVGKCLRLRKPPSKPDFFRDYAFRSRPVIVENAVQNWPAFKKWTAKYLRERYGERQVHIKLTPDGVFEGVESARIWSDYRQDWIPEAVKSQLQFPDLVVVRPATSEMRFSDFLDFIASGNRTFSAYLEYSSIPYYMPSLQQDIFELPFVGGELEVKHLNMWLSDGNTLGKLHFDPYDNLLCQVSGEKHVTLFDPHHNENLYEAHIPEAILSYSPRTGHFSRQRLLESTSMVMSPVDIQDPDLVRFPRFSRAHRLECDLGPGDVLFMPAFWWHEVRSRPDLRERRNLAVNFWYEPVLTKEFPCPECRLQFNFNNRHLLGK